MPEVKILLKGYMKDLGNHRYDVKTTISLIRGKNNIVVDSGNLGQDREIIDALEREGLKPEDVEIIIQTHLHHDHCGNTSKCKNAEVYVQEAEWIFMQGPHPLQAQYYPKELYKGWKVRLIKGDHELFPGITLAHTPGHTPGTQSVIIDTEEGRAAIPGFCCTTHTFQNPSDALPQGHPFGAWETFVPSIATDLSESYNSTLRLKSTADIMLPCHGPGYDERTKKYL